MLAPFRPPLPGGRLPLRRLAGRLMLRLRGFKYLNKSLIWPDHAQVIARPFLDGVYALPQILDISGHSRVTHLAALALLL